MIDARIPLMAQGPFQLAQGVNRINLGNIKAQQEREDMQRREQMRDLFSQQGAGIFNADPDALAALAAIDPGAAQQAQRQAAMLGMQRERMNLARNADRRADDALGFNQNMAQQQLAIRVGEIEEKRKKEAEDAEIAAEQAATDRAVAVLSGVRDADQWDAYARRSFPEYVGKFEQRDEIINGLMGVKDVLARRRNEMKDGISFDDGLRKEWTALTKEDRAVFDSYSKVLTSAKLGTGPGDISLIFAYMKMLDPTSVVREGEQATAANAGGVAENVMNIYNRLLSGERLTPKVRRDFIVASGSLLEEKSAVYQDRLETYRDIAKRRGGSVENAVPDFLSRLTPVDEALEDFAASPGGDGGEPDAAPAPEARIFDTPEGRPDRRILATPDGMDAPAPEADAGAAARPDGLPPALALPEDQLERLSERYFALTPEQRNARQVAIIRRYRRELEAIENPTERAKMVARLTLEAMARE